MDAIITKTRKTRAGLQADVASHAVDVGESMRLDLSVYMHKETGRAWIHSGGDSVPSASPAMMLGDFANVIDKVRMPDGSRWTRR